MKISQSLTFVSLTSVAMMALVTGCGSFDKNPVPDLAQMRANAQTNQSNIPHGAQTVNVPVVQQVPVYVTKYEPNPLAQPATTGVSATSSVVISPDSDMNYIEGRASTFKIRTQVTLQGLKVRLKATSLPPGATLTPDSSEADTYDLTWTPPVGTVDANSATRTKAAIVGLDVVAAPSPDIKNQVQAITAGIKLVVSKDQTPPSELTVSGLGSEVKEGSVTPFTVTVTVPGMDDKSSQKPELHVSYDSISVSKGNKFMEMDGARHIPVVPAPTYLGNDKWQFSLNYDTKDISVLPQLDANKAPIKNADGTRVRFKMQVTKGDAGPASPAQVVQLKIDHAPETLKAPSLDIPSGLEVAPGDSFYVDFIADSSNADGSVKVDAGNLNGIPGSPKVTCNDSSYGAYRQICQITWKVPCDAKVSDLNQKFSISAVTSINGKKSDAAKKDLVTTASKTANPTCSSSSASASKKTTTPETKKPQTSPKKKQA